MNVDQNVTRQHRAFMLTLFRSVFAVLLSCSLSTHAEINRMHERPPITGIAFVSFDVSDATAGDRFYGGALGLTHVLLSDGEPVAPLHLFAVNSQQWISFKNGDARKAKSRLRIVGFTTTDLPTLREYLAEHGYRSVMPVSPGELAIRDPKGNFIIFVQKDNTEGVLHSSTSRRAIAHLIVSVGFVVHDPQTENRFWCDILGFRPDSPRDADPASVDHVSLHVPDGTDRLEYMLNVSARANERRQGIANHVTLGAERMSDVIMQLRQNGCKGHSLSVKRNRDGTVRIDLFDPSKSRIEVMELR